MWHFVGIGGISMSALAVLLHTRGEEVSGSDSHNGEVVEVLRNLGIEVRVPHGELPIGASKVVVNGAISADNPELVAARERGNVVYDRSELLAEISKDYKEVIAIAGTSGKSTTTAMIGEIFKAAGRNPTIHNGAVLHDETLGLHIGGQEFFITEACEFKRSFLTLSPTVAVITNIRADHLNCYENLQDLHKTFEKFKDQSGAVISHETITDIPTIKLSIPGVHNCENAALALAVARHFGIEDEITLQALKEFRGLKRRFEILGKVEGTEIISDYSKAARSVTVVSDYAHHPAEIATTIESARSKWDRYLIVFQPHTYTRTATLFCEFLDVLWDEDVVLYKTYSAREREIIGGRAEDLADALNQPCFHSSERLLDFIRKASHRYEAIIFTGAGDIDDVARSLIKQATRF